MNPTLKKSLKFAVLIFIGIRIYASLVLLIGIFQPPFVFPNEEYARVEDQKLMDGGFFTRYILEPWFRWDTVHYIEISEKGYVADSNNTVWPPLFPFLIKITGLIFKPPLLAAIIVSNIFFIIAVVLLYLLIIKYFNEEVSKNSIAYLLFFPTSFFLIAPYTESLFLTLTLALFLALIQKKWWLAGVISGLAALTRVQGVFLIIPIFIEGYLFYRPFTVKRIYFKFLPACLIAPFAYGLFCLYVRFGILAEWPWVTLNTYWGQHFGYPWEGLWGNITALFGRELQSEISLPIVNIISILSTIISIYFLVKITKKIPLSLSVYSWFSLFLVLSKIDDQYLMISTMRYLLLIFPIFISQAILFKNRNLKLVYFASGMVINTIFLVFNYWWIWVA